MASGVHRQMPPAYSAVRAVQAKALQHGAHVHDNFRVEWDAYGRCEAPVTIELHARPDRKIKFGRGWSALGRKQEEFLAEVRKHFPDAQLGPSNEYVARRAYTVSAEPGSATVTLTVPCRKCTACLRARAWLWRTRAVSEVTAATLRGCRTWFVTLTCRPDVHHSHLAQARQRLDTQGIEYGGLSSAEQFCERHRPLAREATKWLKRVRKASKARFRYLLVTEIHHGGGQNDGEPHLHLLVHETDSATPVRERDLRLTWPHGHAKAVLVKELGRAVYLTKYLSKDARARVRASARYGSFSLEQAKPGQAREKEKGDLKS